MELLDKESINLPQIMKILGDRPYPLKESIKEYLEELEKRKEEEEKKAEDAEIDAAEQALSKDDATATPEGGGDSEAKTTDEAAEDLKDPAKPLDDAAAEKKDDKK